MRNSSIQARALSASSFLFGLFGDATESNPKHHLPGPLHIGIEIFALANGLRSKLDRPVWRSCGRISVLARLGNVHWA
jgi:hypothetical protein